MQTTPSSNALVPTIVSLAEMQQLKQLDSRLCDKHYVKQGSEVYAFGPLGCVTYKRIHNRVVRKSWCDQRLVDTSICDL